MAWTAGNVVEIEEKRGYMGEFLKGYAGKMGTWGSAVAGYSRDGDSRGLARACDETI